MTIDVSTELTQLEVAVAQKDMAGAVAAVAAIQAKTSAIGSREVRAAISLTHWDRLMAAKDALRRLPMGVRRKGHQIALGEMHKQGRS